MADDKKIEDVTNTELVADDPGLTSPPTQIVLEEVNPLNPKVVKEAEEKVKEKK